MAEDRVILPSHSGAYQTSGIEYVVGPAMEGYTPDQFNVAENDVNISIPVTESSLSALNFVMEESKNIKGIINTFDVAYESVSLSKDGKNIYLKEKEESDGIKRTFTISLEQAVCNEISDYLADLHYGRLWL